MNSIEYSFSKVTNLNSNLFSFRFSCFFHWYCLSSLFLSNKNVGPTRTVSVTLLVPIFGIIWGGLFLNEHTNISTYLGLAIIMTSIFFVLGVTTLMCAPMGPIRESDGGSDFIRNLFKEATNIMRACNLLRG
ncbi:EamA family transporter [Peribacillus simplex]